MVYGDVVRNGWILPYKKKYTMRDFKKLNDVHDRITSRFIIVCSAVFYWDKGMESNYSKCFDKIENFYFM